MDCLYIADENLRVSLAASRPFILFTIFLKLKTNYGLLDRFKILIIKKKKEFREV